MADVHLRGRDAPNYGILRDFLLSLLGSGSLCGEEGINDLYFVGDFFDFWFSRGGKVYPEFVEIVTILGRLKERGINIHLCEGNHDFYLNDYFGRYLGFEIIEEGKSIDLEGQKVFISHGDTVDRTNKRYLLLRSFLRSSLFRRVKELLPIKLLWQMARLSSHLSKELTIETREELAEKMRLFSHKKFQEGFDVVILGHCHKPLLETQVLNGRRKTLILLGDWLHYFTYLCYNNGYFTLNAYKQALV